MRRVGLTLRPKRLQSPLMRKTARPAVVLAAMGCSLALFACHSYKDTAIQGIRENRDDIKTCISEGVQRNAQLKGAMEMRIQVAPNGKINQFAFSKDEVKDPQFSECIKNRAIQWQLPAPPSGKMETFEYKFNVGMK